MNVSQKDNGVNSLVRSITRCRMCASVDLKQFLDLGNQPLANAFLSGDQLSLQEVRYPLGVLFCADCNLVQLSHVVRPEILFAADYVYLSSGMPSSSHFREYVREVHSRFLQSKEDFVVEIGSNDGHLLSGIQTLGVRVLGVDPAKNVAAIANERGVLTIPEFFTENLGGKIREKLGIARVIIGNNVVAHIDDHHDLLRGILTLLADDGVFVFEAPYLGDMFEYCAFDSIYHEHMSYLALSPLIRLFKNYGMEIFDVKSFPVQGNSLRYYAAKKGTRAIEPCVAAYLERERIMGFHEFVSYETLAKKIKVLRDEVRNTVFSLKKQGARIAAYGAPARGNTLLNYFGIGREVLDYATEALPSKIGKFTPGLHIPIVDISWARQNPPDYYLLLAWPYKDVVLEKEKDFVAKGRKFIMPVGGIRILL